MFKKRPSSSEVDPLLPNDEPAPEIQAYGSSRSNLRGSSEINYGNEARPPPTDQDHYYEDNDDEEDAIRPSATAAHAGPRFTRRPSTRSGGSNGEKDPQSRSSAWGSFVTFLTFGVFFALVVLALRGAEGDDDSNTNPPSIPVPSKGHDRTPPGSLDERVTKILTETPLMDGHNDLAIFIREFYQNAIHSQDFKDKFEGGEMAGHVDLPRLKAGMAGGAFWSAFVVCPEHASDDFSDTEYGVAVAETLQQIDLIKRLQHQYPDRFSPAGTSLADMLKAFHGDKKKMLGPVSLEGLHQIPPSAAMSTLRLYYEVGVRAATLTWNCHNAFADAALVTTRANGTVVAGPHRGGLTDIGRAVIFEMNRLGIIVDLSHTSYWTQKAVLTLEQRRAPVIFTHSSAWALCPHPRNVHDDILDLVRATDSVVMVNFSPNFVSCVEAGDDPLPTFYEPNSTLHQVARHIVYIGDKIGYGHVGLGSDFDGIETTPRGLDGVDKYPDLVKELLGMGVSDADAAKVVGGNVLRVWTKVEEVAAQMQRDGVREGEDEISDRYGELNKEMSKKDEV